MLKILHHFYFRFQQFFRVGNLEPRKGLGFAVFTLVIICAKLPQPIYYVAGFSAIIFAFHFGRKDIPFLRKIFKYSWAIIFVEYLLVYSLFVFVNINYQVGKEALIAVPTFLLLSFLKSSSNKFIPKLNIIPGFYFEWKSYFRGNFIASVFVYLIIIASAWHRSTLLFSVLFFTEFLVYIFKYNESKEILTNFFRTNTFKEKVIKNVKFYNILLIPVSIFFLVKNYEDWQFLVYYLLYTNAFLLLVITRKYKIYSHKKQESYFDFGTSFEFLLLSITIIPAVIVIKSNLESAEKNIKSYVGN